MLFDPRKNHQLALAIGLTFQLVISVILGYYIGDYIDGTFGSKPFGSLGGSLLGFAAGTITLLKTYNKMEK